ncbi:MAG: hypothetical protein ABI596_02400 [Pyrinomonadaceae bacterium]
MRNQVFRTVTMIGVLIILSAVSARAQGGAGFRVTVPFDFIVSAKTFPAGEYIVTRSTRGSAEGLRIQARDGKNGAYVMTMPVAARDIQSQTKAVFRRYDNQYFLSQVWISGRATGREMVKPDRQRSLEHELARRSKAETIALVGRPN